MQITRLFSLMEAHQLVLAQPSVCAVDGSAVLWPHLHQRPGGGLRYVAFVEVMGAVLRLDFLQSGAPKGGPRGVGACRCLPEQRASQRAGWPPQQRHLSPCCSIPAPPVVHPTLAEAWTGWGLDVSGDWSTCACSCCCWWGRAGHAAPPQLA